MIAHQNSYPQKPIRVVLLGGSGFIGHVICKQLEAQDIPFITFSSKELNLAAADAPSKLALMLKPSDAIIMLAALTPDRGRDIATLMKNLTMMQSVCSVIEKSASAHFIYFSSDAVYNLSVSHVTENTLLSPQDLYGAMHYTREVMIRGLAYIPLLVLRPTLVYGFNDTHNSYGPNRFCRIAKKEGKIILFGGGEETRDHIHVDDIAKLTVHCLLRRSVGTLNVATGISKSFYEVAEIVAKQFNNGIKIIKAPRINPITYRHYDLTNLIKAFPDFRFTRLEEGIRRIHKKMVENI